MSPPLRRRLTRRRRGAALLVALAALAVVTVAAGGAVRGAADASLRSRRAAFDLRAEAFFEDARPLALAWLRAEAARPARARDGFELVLSLPIGPAGSERAQIRVIDLSGRLHLGQIATTARAGLPEPLRTIDPEAAWATARSDAEAGATPESLAEQAARISGAAHSVAAFPRARASDGTGSNAAVVAEWLTAHGSGALNVNSAPPPLLRAALAGRDASATQAALAARRRGEPVPAAAIALLTTEGGGQSVSGGGGGGLCRLAANSDAYGFLVSVEDGGLRRRWWIVAVAAHGGEQAATPFRRPWPEKPQTKEHADASEDDDRGRVSGAPGWAIVEARPIDP